MNHLKLFARLAVTVAACSVSSGYATPVTPVNLIVNGDAESGTGGDGTTLYSIPGFTTTGNFTVAKYGTGGGFPLSTSPGPGARGVNLFVGGLNSPASSASQSISVSSLAGIIDTGAARYDLSAFLGGYADQADNATLTATFQTISNVTLGSVSIGPVSNTNRTNITGLLFRENIGAIPTGTRLVKILLSMTRVTGGYNDGYADNLSLTVSAVPEPSTYLIMFTGLLALGIRYRRTQILPNAV